MIVAVVIGIVIVTLNVVVVADMVIVIVVGIEKVKRIGKHSSTKDSYCDGNQTSNNNHKQMY